MSTYQVVVSKKAGKFISSLDKNTQRRIEGAFAIMSVNPFPANSRKVATSPYHRVRIGDYRIIYEINQGLLRIHVVRIDHQRDVYRNL